MKFLRDNSGFTMAFVLVAMTIFLILAGVASTKWSFIKTRAKEEELIFRGEQYARAIRMYFFKFKTYPDKLEELLDEKCIRRLYPDPMTEDGEWELIRGDIQSVQKSSLPGQTPVERVPPVEGREEGGDEQAEAEPESFIPQVSQNVMSGIIGVRSKSRTRSIREYKGERFYNKWSFIAKLETGDKPPGIPQQKQPPGTEFHPPRSEPDQPRSEEVPEIDENREEPEIDW